MREPFRHAVGPFYLLACLLLGGSAQGIWQNMILQLLGLMIIAWAGAVPAKDPLARPVRQLFFLAIAAIAVVALQLIPLPPSFWVPASFWSHGPRLIAIEGYRLLGRPVPPLPISITPYESLATLLCFIPPLAMFCAMARLKAFNSSWIAIALIGGAIAGTMLGALQVADSGAGSRWYLYQDTNFGLGVGFFANANHMANLLVITLPFVAAITATARGDIHRYSAMLVASGALAIVLLVGIGMNGSLAAYLLAVPVVAMSVLVVLPAKNQYRTAIASVAALVAVLAIAALAASSIGSSKIGGVARGSVESRAIIMRTTTKAISDFMPLGSGLGSFPRVYRLYESPEAVTTEYVVHVHNDYAELALELGAPGIILIFLFLWWWGRAVYAVWRKHDGNPFTRAATIATGAILLHSLVDFPLRTAAISTCFAMCLSLLADQRLPQRQDPTDLRPTRHMVFT